MTRRFLFLSALLLLLCVPAQAAISILDAAANSGSRTGGSSANTMSYTVSSGTATILLCSISAADVNSRTGSSVTWNGASMTIVPSSRLDDVPNNAWAEWWYLKNPTPASSQNISVTLTGDVAYNFAFGCLTFSGVDQSTTFDTTAITGTGASTSPSVSITTATNGAEVLGVAFFNFNVTITDGGGFTLVYHVNDAGNGDAFAAERINKATAGAQSVNWSIDVNTSWLISAIALRPDAGGGGGGGGPKGKRLMTLGVPR